MRAEDEEEKEEKEEAASVSHIDKLRPQYNMNQSLLWSSRVGTRVGVFCVCPA